MARSVLEQLVVELSTDNTRLRAGLQDAERQTTSSAARLRQNARAIGTAVAATTAAFTAVTGALITATNRVAGYADEIDKAALRTRLSRGAVQELRFVTDQLGGSFSTIETAVVGLTQRLAGAEQGSERQSEAFRRLGVATRDAGGQLRSTEELLFDSIGALQGVSNETERAVLAQEVFGRSAAQLAPLLAAGAGSVDELRARARDLGLVLDDQSVGALVQYKDAVSQVQQQFGALGRDLTIQFLPILTDGLLPVVERALGVFRGLPEPVQRGAAALVGFATAAGAATTALRLLGVPLASLFGPVGLIALGIGAVGTLAVALATGRDSLAASAERTSQAIAGGNSGTLTGALDDLIDAIDGPTRDSLERLRSDFQQTGTLGVEQAQRVAAAWAEAQLLTTQRSGIANIIPGLRGSAIGEAFGLAALGGRVPDGQARVETALQAGDTVTALQILNDVVSTLEDLGLGIRSGPIRDLIQGIESIQSTAFGSGVRDIGGSTPVASLAGSGSGVASGSPAVAAAANEAAEDIVITSIQGIPDDVRPALGSARRTEQARLEALIATTAGQTVDLVNDVTGALFGQALTNAERLAPINVADEVNNRIRVFTGDLVDIATEVTDQIFGIALTNAERLAPVDVSSQLTNVLAARQIEANRAIAAATVSIPVPTVSATVTPRGTTPDDFLQAFIDEQALARLEEARQAQEDAAAAQERYTSVLGRAQIALGGGVTANEALALELESLIDVTPEFSDTLRELAGALREADAEAEAFRAQQEAQRQAVTVINAATSATNGLVNSIRELQQGNLGQGVGGLFGVAGGIAGLFNPVIGAILGGLGSIFANLFGRRDQTNANLESRAAGAQARGAPAVEFNVTQNNSIAVNGIPELRGALGEAIDDLARIIETNLVPRIQRLEGAS